MNKLLPEEPQVFEMKDYYGPDRGLCQEDEIMLKTFIEDAELIGIPRSRARCAVDIQEYVREKQLVVPFTNDKPGNLFSQAWCMPVQKQDSMTACIIHVSSPYKSLRGICESSTASGKVTLTDSAVMSMAGL